MDNSLVLIAADHGGFNLKKHLIEHAKDLGVAFKDLGTNSTESVDYPDFAKKLCREILDKKASRGILVCGSAQGVAIQANRFKGIRATICWTPEIAKAARSHNNSNVLCLGERVMPQDGVLAIVKAWLTTEFEGGRHERRVEKMDQD